MILITEHKNEFTLPLIDIEVVSIYVQHQGQIVSSCYIALFEFSGPTLYAVETLPAFRRQGFGHELMRGVERAMRLYRIRRCVLQTGRKCPARHLYEAHGWIGYDESLWTGTNVFCMERVIDVPELAVPADLAR